MADLAADADVLMNLVASGEVSAVIRVVGTRLLVCPEVEAEALYIEKDPSGIREPIDLEPLFNDGTLVRATLSPTEIDEFVALARAVDDGEAQALAIAKVRQVPVATDDRRAIRVARELGIVVLDTPELMLRWAATVAGSRAAEALRRIERQARFTPRAMHSLRVKWESTRDQS